MKAKDFINIAVPAKTLLKLKLVDENGNWYDIGLDEEMPDIVYGYAIYVKAKFPTSFIAELQASDLIR